MRETRFIMGMPVIAESTKGPLEDIFEFLRQIDERFSPFKETSEVSRFNAGLLSENDLSADVRYVLAQCERTKQETDGYFDCYHKGKFDPSGYVKGWAIQRAADMLAPYGSYYMEIAGDLQVGGTKDGQPWAIGVRNPFNATEIVKRVALSDAGIATSGTAARGQHIYNPHAEGPINEIVSLSVIAPKIVDADRFATAAFAMGRAGIEFIARQPGLEGYMIESEGIATFTPGFNAYVI